MKSLIKNAGFKISKVQSKEFGLVTIMITTFFAFHFRDYNYIKAAFVLTVLTLILPSIFYPFSFCWFGLGKILGIISSFILLSAIYFLIVVPVGLVRKISGKDDLNLKQFKKSRNSVMTDRNHLFNDTDLKNSF
jgi:Saxitoxin biosynthesis operon protein SxtJ